MDAHLALDILTAAASGVAAAAGAYAGIKTKLGDLEARVKKNEELTLWLLKTCRINHDGMTNYERK